MTKSPEECADDGINVVMDELALFHMTDANRTQTKKWFERYYARMEENKASRGLPPEAIAVICKTT